jgi:hypothetical protein
MTKTITYQAIPYPLPPLDALALKQAGSNAIAARASGEAYRARLATLCTVEANLRQRFGVEVTRERFLPIGVGE